MKVLAYTTPARGHLYPIVPLLTELRRRGHQVHARTVADELGTLHHLGLDADAIDQRIPAIALDDYLGRSTLSSVKRGIASFLRRAEFEIPDLRAAIEQVTPDVLLIDTNAWGAAAAAEASGLPWAAYLPFPVPLPAPGVPPFGPGLPPARSAAGRVRDAVLRPVIVGGYERMIREPIASVRRQAGACGEVRTVADLYGRAPLSLYLTVEGFDYPRQSWPVSFRLVGPITYDPPAQNPSWLEEIDRPIVLVTTSSEFQDDHSLVETALAALKDEDIFVVATLPSGELEAFDVPANARVERFVSHSLLLPRAAAVITHGGMGSTQKALAAGVPVVAVPFGRDQAEVARRVEASGAGVRLTRRRLTPDRLCSAVHEAIGRRPHARQLAETFSRAGGASAAADALEELAGVPVR